MTEFTRDDVARLIGLKAAATLMRGRFGGPASIDAVRDWANPAKGYRPRGYDGPPLVLQTVRLGQDMVTLPEWVEEFEQRRFAIGKPAPRLPRGPTARQAAAAHRRAEAYLDAQGVK